MSEPVSSAAALGAFLAKYASIKYLLPLLGLVTGVGAVLYWLRPHSAKEWLYNCLLTTNGSVLLGIAANAKWAIVANFGAAGLGVAFLVFALIPIIVIRSYFTYVERDKTKTLIDYIKEIKAAWKE